MKAPVIYKTAKGTQDFDPRRAAQRQKLVDIFKSKAELYGARPLFTPAIERLDVLMEKYGEDSDKQIFTLTGESESTTNGTQTKEETQTKETTTKEETALRYDLTVPFARWVKTNNIRKIKRYSVGQVWRRDQPNIKAGRYREFLQVDYDRLGDSDTVFTDAETLSLLRSTLADFELPKNFIIRINTRENLWSMLEYVGIEEDKFVDVSRVIDKLDKRKWKALVPELEELGVSDESIEMLKNVMIQWGKPLPYGEWVQNVPFVDLAYFQQLFSYLEMFGNTDSFRIDLSLARGLNYYTGVIFEVILEKSKNTGSIAGGGRYDKLCDAPCVGFSIGIDRIMTVMKPISKRSFNPTVWVTQIDKTLDSDTIQRLYQYRLETVVKLRNKGISSDTEARIEAGFGPQLKYVLKNSIPYVVFLGLTELQNNTVTLKDMDAEIQYDSITIETAMSYIRNE